MSYSIYSIRHPKSNKIVYIGCTSRLNSRMSAIRNMGHGKLWYFIEYLQREKLPFKYTVLKTIENKELAFEIETLLIIHYKPKYNVAKKKYSLEGNIKQLIKTKIEDYEIRLERFIAASSAQVSKNNRTDERSTRT